MSTTTHQPIETNTKAGIPPAPPEPHQQAGEVEYAEPIEGAGTTELVRSVSIENMVNQREAVLSRLKSALELLRDAADLAGAAHVGFPDIGMNCRGGRDFDQRLTGGNRASIEALLLTATKAVDASAWAYLMRESGLRTFMDAKARQDWEEKVQALDVPPLTAANVAATFTALHDSRGDLFERGVINCFRSLSWNYKTNQPFKFGKRVILRGLFSLYGSGPRRWLSLNYSRTNSLDDLDRAFHVLDGKPEPDHRAGWSQLIKSNDKAGATTGPYFSVKWFLNGNGHLTFNRQDLVDKMNAILAKHHPNALASEVH